MQKPKYNIFKNTKYAIEGFIAAFKYETSFKIEVIIGLFLIPCILIFDVEYKLALISSYVFILIVELLNSAIENVVDLVTNEIHPLAKRAKDIAATAVMGSIVLHIIVWCFVLEEFL